MKVKRAIDDSGVAYGYTFFCPGCGYAHVYYVEKPCSGSDDTPQQWQFNGNMENPTFTPSLLNTTGSFADPNYVDDPEIPPTRCHLFVTDGVINYCTDCTHKMAGHQRVPMRITDGPY